MNFAHDSKPLGPTARPNNAWELYNEKARFRDKALMKDWVSSINSLLLFAAIFAAVLTALCVESRKLLEPDPLSSIDQTLQYIAYMVQRSNDPSAIPPTPIQPFQPSDWAVIVNAFFFTSLTTSILAAVGAVTCLQWVEEYDAGLEAASTPKDRAIRSHYRYRATENWYMRHMIAFLPIILYFAVGFFFIGLMLWFWHIHQLLAFIPLTGFLIWAVDYIATTLMAVFHPSAPYRTAVSRALFRAFFLASFYASKCARALILGRSLLKFIRHSFNPGKEAWNESRNQFLLDKLEFSRQIKSKLLKQYPWMAPGRDVRQSMHSHVREKGRVAKDETIHISTLAWLASSIDLSEQSILDFHLVITELNNLSESKLLEWQDHNYDAPWSHIFNIVIDHSNADDNPDSPFSLPRIIPTLAQVLHKMSLHPILFERTIQHLDTGLIVAFMRRLESMPPRDEEKAHSRLKSIISLLSSKRWAEMNTKDWADAHKEEQPVRHVLKIILDCLDLIGSSENDPSNLASWVFTLCHVEKEKCDAGKVLSWPKPELIRFIPDAFTNQDLREHALVHFLQFVDSILCDAEPAPSNTRWRWRWNRAIKITEDDQLVALKLLVHHFLRIFFTFEESRDCREQFSNLLHHQKIESPTLRLVIAAFGGHRQMVKLPPDNDAIWNNEAWQYAVSIWYGFQTHYPVCDGRQISAHVPMVESTKMITALRNVNPAGLYLLITRSTETPPTSKPSNFWISLFQLIQGSEDENVHTFSSLMVGLYPEQWLHIFTNFHAIETPDAPNSVTSAMLQTLKDSFRSDLFRLGWRAAAANERAISTLAIGPARPTPIARFAKTVHDVLQRDRPGQTPRLPLPSGLLLHIRDVLRVDQSDVGNPTFERLRACIAIVDELALVYANGNRRDQNYARLFLEISQAMRPVKARFTPEQVYKLPSTTTVDELDDVPDWPDKLRATVEHTFHAGMIPLKLDVTPVPPGRVSRRNTVPEAPIDEKPSRWVLGSGAKRNENRLESRLNPV